jgi:hypothetical protein
LVKVDDNLESIDPLTGVREVHKVTVAQKSLQPCLRLTTETGIVLECSASAPLANFKGQQVWADRLKQGDRVTVMDQGELRVDKIASIEPLGLRAVMFISNGHQYYFAGQSLGRYFLHRNLKVDPSIRGPVKLGYDPNPNVTALSVDHRAPRTPEGAAPERIVVSEHEDHSALSVSSTASSTVPLNFVNGAYWHLQKEVECGLVSCDGTCSALGGACVPSAFSKMAGPVPVRAVTQVQRSLALLGVQELVHEEFSASAPFVDVNTDAVSVPFAVAAVGHCFAVTATSNLCRFCPCDVSRSQDV